MIWTVLWQPAWIPTWLQSKFNLSDILAPRRRTDMIFMSISMFLYSINALKAIMIMCIYI